MSTETELRQRMTAYADTLTPPGPDLAGAAATARRQRRGRTRAAAGLTVAVVALAAVGIGSATGHHTARIQPSAPRDTAGAPLPGFARVAQVTVPAELGVFTAVEAGGQVWAIASNPSDNEPILLHAADGQQLREVASYPYADVSDEHLAIRDGHTIVVSTENDVSGSPQRDAELTVYDARSTAVLRSEDLSRRYGVAGADLVTADGGSGPLSIVLAGSGSAALTQQVRTGLVGSDGTVSDLTPALEVAALGLSAGREELAARSPLELGSAPYPPDFSELQLLASEAGVPRYLILDGQGSSSVRRLDLRTGAVTQVLVDSRTVDGSGLQPRAVGVLGGRILYATAHGLDVGPVTSDRPAPVPGSAQLAASQVEIVGGQAYVIDLLTTRQTARALSPATLLPDGPVVTAPLNSIVARDGAVVFVAHALTPASGSAVTLTAYARE